MIFLEAAFTAFFGVFQISELVVRSWAESSANALQRLDVQVVAANIYILLRRSKTDQHRKGMQVVLGPCGECDICPITALSEYLSIRGDSSSLLFIHANGTPLNKTSVLGNDIPSIKCNWFGRSTFYTHSFRIGAASTAAAMGYQTHDIQRIGRWQSRVFQAYVWPIHKV